LPTFSIIIAFSYAMTLPSLSLSTPLTIAPAMVTPFHHPVPSGMDERGPDPLSGYNSCHAREATPAVDFLSIVQFFFFLWVFSRNRLLQTCVNNDFLPVRTVVAILRPNKVT
jgi:hypothetical protein